MSNFDELMMQRCIRLAENGLGTTYPNPMVGCVIVHDGKIIAEGWHQKAGGFHAEAAAVHKISDKEILKKSILYVSLEPCSHFGKTPPCSDLIIRYQIPEVVIGCVDPNVKVNGSGIQKLQNAGVDVKVGVLESECLDLNKRFFTYHQKRRPFVILKWAQTADGFMSPQNGAQKWITHEFSKQLVHKWRTEEQAILVGTHTAQTDNPQLNARLWNGNQPMRVVLDRGLNLSADLNLFDSSLKTIVFTEKSGENKSNLTFIKVDFDENLAKKILDHLFELGIQSIIVEGGKQTLETFIEKGLWDEARILTSEENWGEGINSPPLIGELKATKMIQKDRLEIFRK